MIFLPHYRVPQYSPSSTSSGPITKSQWPLPIFQKPPSPPPSACSNSLECRSDSEMQPKRSNGSWTKSYMAYHQSTYTSTTSSLPALLPNSTSRTYVPYSPDWQHTESSSTPTNVCSVHPPFIFSDTTSTATVSPPVPEKVQVIRDFPQPQSQRQLRRFIGLVNFYHRFLPHCAELMLPLHSLLKGKSKSITWTDAATTSFNATKEALAKASLLTYPTPDAPTCLTTDASDTAVGAVLQQNVCGTWTPISFFSRKLTPAETRYSTFDRELLAVYLGIQHFRHFLEGRLFHVLTDHKPLTYALNSRSDRYSPRQARQLDYISQFTSTIRHVQGIDNVVADALSRVETNALLTGQPPTVDFAAIAATQATDPLIRSFQSSQTSALVVEAVPLENSPHHPLYCDTSTGTQRPIVPLPWRRTIFNSLHNLSHPGIRATQKLIALRFVWPRMNSDIRHWTRSCIQCQRAKVQRHSSAPLSSFPTPDAHFDAVHIDIVGPLPPSQGYTYLLTCVDRYTRWPEAIPISTITSEAVAQAFVRGWISRFGVPSTIVTDRGRQFESHLWNNLMALLGTKRSRTTSYHPQANGIVERFHRQLKAALKAQPNPDAWMTSLPILLGIRTALKQDLNATTAEMVYGSTLRLPGEFFTPSPTTALPDPSEFLNTLKTHPTYQTYSTPSHHQLCLHPTTPIYRNTRLCPPRCSAQTPSTSI